MQIEVPGGTSLIFSGPDGELLARPATAPITRVITGATPPLGGSTAMGAVIAH